MKILENKTALVTGAARGIGKAIALRYAEEGADVLITDLKKDDALENTAKEIEAHGVKVWAFASDASNAEAATELAKSVQKECGGIDILVNNAGITRDTLLMRMSEEQWDSVINVNLKSVFNMTKAFMRMMLKQRHGSIINISSIVGVHGNAGQTNYAASKAGIIGFTKSVAQELGSRNIRCNAVAPGFIETEMTSSLNLDEATRKAWMENIPLKRGGKPEEVGDVCVFLGSDLSSYVSGQVIHVCGGMTT